jgi:hypothetical protein
MKNMFSISRVRFFYPRFYVCVFYSFGKLKSKSQQLITLLEDGKYSAHCPFHSGW